MNRLQIDDKAHEMIVSALEQISFFEGLKPTELDWIADQASAYRYEPDDHLIEAGASSDAFLLLMRGGVSVRIPRDDEAEEVEVAQLEAVDTLGEVGLLLDEPRTASVVALEEVTALHFEPRAFEAMYHNLPKFGLGVSRALAERLSRTSHQLPVPDAGEPDNEGELESDEAFELLPRHFIERHRVLPLSIEEQTLILGVVDDPSTEVLSAVHNALPGLQIETKRISSSDFKESIRSNVGDASSSISDLASETAADGGESSVEVDDSLLASDVQTTTNERLSRVSPRLQRLLRQMVSEGASDLHLSAGQQPRWRLDGMIRPLRDADPLGSTEVLEMLQPLLGASELQKFEESYDIDFGMTVEGLGRFRANLFMDHRGVGAVVRLIPGEIMDLQQLGLPAVTEKFCDQPKGLVLVTGPTGCGKSTTLASMINHINEHRREHIITIEDPIEYVHESKKCLINQRDVGVHTENFTSALRSALREDPDVILVGELRDLETIRIALETANTGHLVFGSLHTATAAGTIDRILGMFPSDEEDQVRNTLADTLRGVISQVLCRQKGGGQTVAYEVLVSDHAVSNLIRENKTHQIPNAMQTHREEGNILLNATLAQFVRQGKITYREALGKTTDRDDLAKRLDKPVETYY